MTITERVMAGFRRHFADDAPRLVRSPGRVNLIGEHTDYNDGWALPMAIDRAMYVAFAPREDDRVDVLAMDMDERCSFDLDSFRMGGPRWSEYIKGVAHQLRTAGIALRGWQGVIGGDIPIAAGLSSSAALELAAARVFAALGGWTWQAHAAARLCQRAEVEWVGVQCGILDQLVTAAGVANSALLLDCRTLELAPIPLPPSMTVVIMDTGVRRELATTAYNDRRGECDLAAKRLAVSSLRDFSETAFEEYSARLDDRLRRRVRHVIMENTRTLEAAEALRSGDVTRFGALLDASHASLRDDYEVSCSELDDLTTCARCHPSCFGARMTGAGFGGCAIACVRSGAVAEFTQHIAGEYCPPAGRELTVWPCAGSPGTTLF